jgi:hypothetical protein
MQLTAVPGEARCVSARDYTGHDFRYVSSNSDWNANNAWCCLTHDPKRVTSMEPRDTQNVQSSLPTTLSYDEADIQKH